jgi:hypothetical protein
MYKQITWATVKTFRGPNGEDRRYAAAGNGIWVRIDGIGCTRAVARVLGSRGVGVTLEILRSLYGRELATGS